MKATTWGSVAALAVLSLCGDRAWAASAPVVVSPGSATGTSIVDHCPTFSWGHTEGAVSYEVVVYRVGDQGVEADPVLSQEIPGAGLVWTPSVDLCLERGEPYAWSVRAATGEGHSAWATPLLFEVAPEPSAEELAAALEVVRRHLAREAGAQDPTRDPRAGPEPAELGEPGAEIPRISASPASVSAGAATAKLTVAGEVRTLGPGGEPRLWGRGRKGVGVYPRHITPGIHFCTNGAGTKFGLSTASVDWGSAADACPAGTWVCTEDEVTPCNTRRPDSIDDGILCDGSPVSYAESAHYGWVEDHTPGDLSYQGVGLSEAGDRSLLRPCWTLPVWCCWE
jgi:hypothetical protein